MNNIRAFFWFFKLSKKLRHVFMFEPIVNWGIIKKSALMMLIGFGLNLEWLIWKVYLYFREDYWQWIHLDVLYEQIGVNICVLCLFILGLLYCIFLPKNNYNKYIIPIFTGILLNISICIESLLVGALSPSNIATYICLTNIILIIFPRFYVYLFLMPCTIFYISCCYLTLHHQLPYDLLFAISSTRYSNSFWLDSMMIMIAPVLIFTLLFTELLLKQWRNRERLIQQTSQRDPLTNIANRRMIDHTFAQLQNATHPYCLVIVDLDFFKQVNDRYGHNMGDQVLIEVAQLLQRTVRLNDIAGRLGGEEFLMILKNQTEENALAIAERCRSAIQNLNIQTAEGISIHLSASFGVASSTADLKPQQVLNLADKALYVAKNSGRNQVQILRAESS